MEMPPLMTARLRVRPFEGSDLDACLELFGGPPEERRRWLQWAALSPGELARLHQPPYGDRAIVELGSGRVIGSVGLVPSLLPLRRGELALGGRCWPEVGLFWALLPSARGRGYATEAARVVADWALQHLDLERIVATTERENLASVRVMERLGMTLLHHTGEPSWLQVVGVRVRQ
jgi:RimJ/RimL family protein N-acetyltransferase